MGIQNVVNRRLNSLLIFVRPFDIFAVSFKKCPDLSK